MEQNSERWRDVIVTNGDYCGYSTLIDKIIIGNVYLCDPRVFNFILDHERRHQEIHHKYGYWGLLHHVIHDYKDRFKLVRDKDLFENYVRLSMEGESVSFKEMVSNIIYSILGIPTVVFYIFGLIRIIYYKFKKDKNENKKER